MMEYLFLREVEWNQLHANTIYPVQHILSDASGSSGHLGSNLDSNAMATRLARKNIATKKLVPIVAAAAL